VKINTIISQARERYILLALFVFAIVVRGVGINYGYYFGDENINEAARALTGQLVPNQHFYPPLLNYLVAFSFAVLYGLGRLIPVWHDTLGFRAHYFSNPLTFYITARFLVVLVSASVAPLFYLLIRGLKFSKPYAVFAGLFAVFIPGMVLLSHISKSDVPLSVCVIFVFYAMLKQLKNPQSLSSSIILGLAIASAMSFKHSYIFFLLPLALGFALIFYQVADGVGSFAKKVVIVSCTALLFWCVFNIGILLDLENFIDYQKIQAIMSIRESSSFISVMARWWEIVADTHFGVNAITLVIFFLFPVMLYLSGSGDKNILYVFWGSTTIGMFVVLYLTGERQQSGLWVPYMTAIQLLAVIGLGLLLKTRRKAVSIAASTALGVTFLLSLYGSFGVASQALAKPILHDLESFILERYQSRNAKILTGFSLRLPQSKAMVIAERERHDRLALKYNVDLPTRAEERLQAGNSSRAMDYFNMPFVFWGLEDADDESLKGNVKAFAWPFQTEEWELDYWLDKDYSVFIISNYEYYINSQVDIMRRFYLEISNRCELVRHFDPVKPLHIEFSASVYECV